MNPVLPVSGMVTNVALPGWFTFGLVGVGAVWLVRAWPPGGPGERSRLLHHAAGSLVVASLATALLVAWGTAAGFMAPPVAGDGMPAVRWRWFLAYLATYWLAAGAGMSYAGYRQTRARALLKMAARDAQLAAMRPPVQPHFLFNTMNAICGYAVKQDNDAVIAMLTRLSDLLRAGYRLDGAGVVPLPQEVRALQSYLELQQLRHGSPVQVEVALDDAAGNAFVAPMILPALVEGAITASAASFTAGVVRVRVWCVDEAIEVEVTGNAFAGSGSESAVPSGGINTEGSMLRLSIPRLTAMGPSMEHAQ
jgi:hypothetical protein